MCSVLITTVNPFLSQLHQRKSKSIWKDWPKYLDRFSNSIEWACNLRIIELQSISKGIKDVYNSQVAKLFRRLDSIKEFIFCRINTSYEENLSYRSGKISKSSMVV